MGCFLAKPELQEQLRPWTKSLGQVLAKTIRPHQPQKIQPDCTHVATFKNVPLAPPSGYPPPPNYVAAGQLNPPAYAVGFDFRCTFDVGIGRTKSQYTWVFYL